MYLYYRVYYVFLYYRYYSQGGCSIGSRDELRAVKAGCLGDTIAHIVYHRSAFPLDLLRSIYYPTCNAAAGVLKMITLSSKDHYLK